MGSIDCKHGGSEPDRYWPDWVRDCIPWCFGIMCLAFLAVLVILIVANPPVAVALAQFLELILEIIRAVLG